MQQKTNGPLDGFEKITFGNGLVLHIKHMPDCPSQYVEFSINAGSLQDGDIPGSVHYTEHVSSENIQMNGKYLDEDEIKAFFLNRIGREAMLGMTSYNHTWYGFSLPSDDSSSFKKALDMWQSHLFEGSLENGLEKHRDIIQKEFDGLMNTQYDVNLHNRQNRMLYGDNSQVTQSFHILGTKASITNMTLHHLNDVRDRYYVPENMNIVSVGGMPISEVVSSFENTSFNDKTGGNRCDPWTRWDTVPKLGELLFMDDLNKRQPGAQSAEYESCALIPGTIGNTVLAAANYLFRGKLNTVVREEQKLAYSIQARYYHLNSHYEHWIISDALDVKGVKKHGGDVVIQSLIDESIDRALSDEDSFDAYKKHMLLAEKHAELTASSIFHRAATMVRRDGSVCSTSQMMKDFELLSFSDVKSVLAQMTTDNRRTQILTPGYGV